MRTTRTGSVLMEFIIVLPIYFVFIGMVFVFGVMSLQGVKLAAIGDRTIAFLQGMTGDLGDDIKANIRNTISRDVELNSDVELSKGWVAEKKKIEGAWSCLVGGTWRINYALTPWTRSLVRDWRRAKMTVEPASAGSDELQGHMWMVSKDGLVEDQYAYYTLMRKNTGRWSLRWWNPEKEIGNCSPGSLLYRHPDSSLPYWNEYVAEEGFPICDGLDEMRESDAPIKLGEKQAYSRYGKFEHWSE